MTIYQKRNAFHQLSHFKVVNPLQFGRSDSEEQSQIRIKHECKLDTNMLDWVKPNQLEQVQVGEITEQEQT